MIGSQEPEIQPAEAAGGRDLRGSTRTLAAVLSTGLSLYALYWVLFIVQPQSYRVSFLLIALVLIVLDDRKH